MKNIKYLLLVITIILLAGCGANDGKEKLDKALENMSKVKSAKIETKMNVSIEGYSIIMNVEEIFNEQGENYTKATTKLLGQTNYSEGYVVVDGDKIIIYSGENGENWTYQEYDSSEIDTTTSTNGISSYASNYKKAKEVKSDLEGHTKLEVTISKEEMMKKFKEGDNEVQFELAEDLVMSVYIKDDYITKIMFNFEDESQVSENGSKTKYSFEFNISEHNSIGKIVVPESVISSATSINE